MSRVAQIPEIFKEDLIKIKNIADSTTQQHRLVLRANMVLACVNGMQIKQIAMEYKVTKLTVRKWRGRVVKSGIKGLYDIKKPGKPIKDPDLKTKILKVMENKPPDGLSVWNGPAIANTIGVSKDKVWRILKKEGIQLRRHHSWCISTDPGFTTKSSNDCGSISESTR